MYPTSLVMQQYYRCFLLHFQVLQATFSVAETQVWIQSWIDRNADELAAIQEENAVRGRSAHGGGKHRYLALRVQGLGVWAVLRSSITVYWFIFLMFIQWHLCVFRFEANFSSRRCYFASAGGRPCSVQGCRHW